MTFDPLKTSKTLTYSLSADFAEIEKSTKSTTYSRKPVVGYEMTTRSLRHWHHPWFPEDTPCNDD